MVLSRSINCCSVNLDRRGLLRRGVETSFVVTASLVGGGVSFFGGGGGSRSLDGSVGAPVCLLIDE